MSAALGNMSTINSPGGGFSVTALITGVVAGSTIACYCQASTGPSSRTVSDNVNAGNYAPLLGTPMLDSNNAKQSNIYIKENCAAGDTTITYTDLNDNAPLIHAVSMTGVLFPNGIDPSYSALSNNATGNPGNPITTGFPGEVILAWIEDGRGGDTSINVSGAGFTRLAGPTLLFGVNYAFASRFAASQGTYDPAWTGVASGRNNMLFTGAWQSLGGGSTAVPATGAESYSGAAPSLGTGITPGTARSYHKEKSGLLVPSRRIFLPAFA
jgi:hypothetical protein